MRLLLLLLLSGCVQRVGLDALPCPCSEGWSCCDNHNICVREGTMCPNLTIDPESPTVSVGHALQLSASEPVIWKAEGGSVDESGLFLAPDEPGRYLVTATSRAAETIQTSTEIEVVPLTLSLVAGQPGGRGFVDGVGANARLGLVTSIVANPDETGVYFADLTNQAIRSIDVTTGKVVTWGGFPDPARYWSGWASKDGGRTQATFYEPYSLAYDGGLIYVHDRIAIRRVNLFSGSVITIAGGHSHNDPQALQDTFGPLVFDEDHSLYLFYNWYDGHHEIRRLDVDTGEIVHVAGTRTHQIVDGVGAAASFGGLLNMVRLPSGNLLLCDSVEMPDPSFPDATIRIPVLRKLETTTTAVSTYPMTIPFCQQMAATATGACFYGKDRYYCATEANLDETDPFLGQGPTLDEPFQTVTFGGTRFFGGRDGEIAQSLSINPPYPVLAGAASNYGYNDGTGGAARFFSPSGVALAEDEKHLFVADRGNMIIRKIDLANGQVTTLAGVAGLTGEGVDGSAFEARFWNPSGMCHANGILYVAESHSIRAVDATTGQTSTLRDLGDDHSIHQISCDDTAVYTVSRIQTVVNGIGKGILAAERIDPSTGEVQTVHREDELNEPMMIAARSGRAPYLIYRPVENATYRVGEIDRHSPLLRNVVTAGDLYLAVNQARLTGFTPVATLDERGRIYVGWSSTLHRYDPATGAVTAVLGDRKHPGLVLGTQPAGLNSAEGLVISRNGDLYLADAVENAIVVAR